MFLKGLYGFIGCLLDHTHLRINMSEAFHKEYI